MEIINLDMTPSTVTPNAHAGQYDTARTVRFMLKNGGVPFTLAGTETITAEITRSDNTEVTVNVVNTSSNYVDVVFDDTVCTVKGLYACELRLKDSDGFDIGSKNFALLVQRDPYDGAGVHVETVGPADICTFETTLPEPLQSVIVDILATGGNGTPDNPNPINGYSSANITRCGINVWDEEYERGYYDASGNIVASTTQICSKNKIRVKPNTTYYFHYGEYKAGRFCYYDVNGNFIERSNIISPITDTTFVIPNNVYFINFHMDYATDYNNDVSLNYPSTDTTYHAYNGQTYTIAFGQTVYGGVLDVTRGKLHVTKGYGLIDGTINPFASNFGAGGYVGYTPSSLSIDNIKLDTLFVSNCYENTGSNKISIYNGNILINDSRLGSTINSLTDWNDWLTNTSNVQFVYELATPFDIDLTPEVISAIVGTNNVFAGCGQSTVKYLKAGA